ncbi:MAG TPA: hypothetical protein VHB18_16130 [Mycobacteriales bacterium]|nr:hypothetical protein [Mycobacteriales bacterium]
MSASEDARAPRAALEALRDLVGLRHQGDDATRKVRPWSRPTSALSNTWQILVGVILTPLGVLFLILGWYGAAHASYVQQQIPYVESGGFIGLGCLILGGLLYWAHWLYRIYDQADLHHRELASQLERHHEGQMRFLEEQIQVLEAVLDGSAPSERSSRRRSRVSTGEIEYFATESGTAYHLRDCAILAHHPQGVVAVDAERQAQMKPCRICISGRMTGAAPAQ